MGFVNEFDVIVALSALEMTLKDLGYAVEMGAGVKAARICRFSYCSIMTSAGRLHGGAMLVTRDIRWYNDLKKKRNSWHVSQGRPPRCQGI